MVHGPSIFSVSDWCEICQGLTVVTPPPPLLSHPTLFCLMLFTYSYVNWLVINWTWKKSDTFVRIIGLHPNICWLEFFSAYLSVGLLSDVISIVLDRDTVTVHCNFTPSVIARIALFWHTVRRTVCESFAAALHRVNCKRLVQEAKQWRARRNHEFLAFLYSLLRCDLFSLLLWRHYGKYI